MKRNLEKFSLAGIPQLHRVHDLTAIVFSAFNFKTANICANQLEIKLAKNSILP